jgi:MFS family permease
MSSFLAKPSPADPPTQAVSTERVSTWFILAIGFGQFAIFVALLAPVFITMQLKAQEIMPSNPASVIGIVLPIGALGSVIANPLFGSLSDRTRTRWGRRRPWLVGGVLFFFVGLVWLAFAPDVLNMILAWLLCQLASNACTAALLASFADNVPESQRGRASAIFNIGINLSILAGIYLAVPLSGNLVVLFIAPGVLAIFGILLYAWMLRKKDTLPEIPPKPFTLYTIISTFWTNPFKNPDFGFAWWSRFLITFATFMFTTYRFLYMKDRLGLSTEVATSTVALGVLIYTIVLMLTAAGSGWLSDRLGRRKIFVGGSTALTAVGLVILAHSDSVGMFYLAEVVMGIAYGVYSAVDTALVIDVLPQADKPGKDLGVLNIANALPQSLAPAAGLFLLGIGSAHAQNYTAMLWGAGIIAVLGALAVIPIKRVR